MREATRAAFWGCLAALAGVAALAVVAWPAVKRGLVADIAAELKAQDVAGSAGRDLVAGIKGALGSW